MRKIALRPTVGREDGECQKAQRRNKSGIEWKRKNGGSGEREKKPIESRRSASLPGKLTPGE